MAREALDPSHGSPDRPGHCTDRVRVAPERRRRQAGEPRVAIVQGQQAERGGHRLLGGERCADHLVDVPFPAGDVVGGGELERDPDAPCDVSGGHPVPARRTLPGSIDGDSGRLHERRSVDPRTDRGGHRAGARDRDTGVVRHGAGRDHRVDQQRDAVEVVRDAHRRDPHRGAVRRPEPPGLGHGRACGDSLDGRPGRRAEQVVRPARSHRVLPFDQLGSEMPGVDGAAPREQVAREKKGQLGVVRHRAGAQAVGERMRGVRRLERRDGPPALGDRLPRKLLRRHPERVADGQPEQRALGSLQDARHAVDPASEATTAAMSVISTSGA